MLLLFAAGLIAVVVIAAQINPYNENGEALRYGSHMRLGMPPCEFYVLFGMPCPACGLTTSFALLAHGDPANAWRANWVGVPLALFCLVLIPWSLYIAIRGQYLWVNSIERASLWTAGVTLLFLLIRWLFVI